MDAWSRMRKLMKRNEQNKVMKEKIIKNAWVELSVYVYEKATMNRICSQISKGVIYHYFKEKDDLYLECVENCYQKWWIIMIIMY